MKKKKLYIASAIILMLVGIGLAAIPPPPVNQDLGLYDTRVAFVSSVTCKGCHPSPQNIHHLMLPPGATPFGCLDCHPTMGTYPDQYQYIERDCQNCHNGTAFWANPAVNLTKLRPPGRPHHNTTKNSSSSVIKAAYWSINRQCNRCHGTSVLANYDDEHYVPSYNTSLVTPLADYKLKNTSGTFLKAWGGCAVCHDAGPMNILNNHDTHHNATSGMKGRQCNYCHVGNASAPRAPPGDASPLRIYLTDPYGFGWDTVNLHMELRNSTILNAGDTINGTGCQKCHSVVSLHNIQVGYVSNGPPGKGHINNNTDCNGCHAFWDMGAVNPFLGPVSPIMTSVAPDTLAPGATTMVTITGDNFVQDDYTTVVLIDGNLIPSSATNTQIVATVPALSAGVHSIQLEKAGVTSKLSSLAVVEPVDVATAKLASGKITITGTGFGGQPDAAFSDLGVFITASGKKGQTTTFKAQVISWSGTQIVVSGSGASAGNLLTVKALNGQASTTISGGGKK